MIDAIVDYFSSMPTSHRSILLVAGLVFFFTLEAIIPLFERTYEVGKHAMSNLFFTVTTAVVNLPFAFLLVGASDWVIDHQVGIIQWLGGGFWVSITLGLLLMDLVGAWTVHIVQHKVKWMWRFHAVHHADQHLDTTSGNRHHPGESVFRMVFTILATLIVGAPIWLIFVYQTLSVVMTQFNHANIALPRSIEKVVNLLLVTPNVHHVHHHYRMPYSDMNYGNIFSIWDRMFGTFIEVGNDQLVYGLDTHMDRTYSANVWSMLKMPFLKYRPHIAYEEEEKLTN